MLRREETNHIRHARKGFRVAVAHSHAAAREQDCIRASCPFSIDRDEPRSFVKISMSFSGGIDKRDFEFARQIRFAVKRIDKIFVFSSSEARSSCLAFHPNLVVRARLRQQRIRKRASPPAPRSTSGLVAGVGARHHVAIHIAARRQGVDSAFD